MRSKLLQFGTLLALLVTGILLWLLKEKWWLAIVLTPIILVAFNYLPKLSSYWKTVYAIFIAIVILVFSGFLLNTIRLNIANPPEWDYTSFWLNGRVAAQRMDFYDPQNYRQVAQTSNLTLDDEFKAEIINVAFWYPPPSILLFLPLGWLSSQSGLIFWYGFQIAVLAGVIYLLWSLFLHNDGRLGLLTSAALTIMLPGTFQTFQLAQTGMLVLLLVLLFWRYDKRLIGGVFLALAILVKPFAAILIFYPLLKRQGRVIVAAAVTIAVLSTIVIAIFGFNTFISYNPLTRLPPIVYIESMNQSLLASILRLTNYDFSSRSPLTHPIYMIAAIVLVSLSAWSVYRLPDSARSWAIAILILLALLVYPATLAHYSVMLLPVIFLIWRQRTRLWGGLWGTVGFITLVYGTLGYNYGSEAVVGFIVCWVFVLVIANWRGNSADFVSDIQDDLLISAQ